MFVLNQSGEKQPNYLGSAHNLSPPPPLPTSQAFASLKLSDVNNILDMVSWNLIAAGRGGGMPSCGSKICTPHTIVYAGFRHHIGSS